MTNPSDLTIASYIAKYMLSHSRLSLDILKDDFALDDLQVRQVLIRLFYQGKIFGCIDSSETGSVFLKFFGASSEVDLLKYSVGDMLDWDVSKFDLDGLKGQVVQDIPIMDDFDITASTSVYSRIKETHQKDLISVELNFDISCDKVALHILIGNASAHSIDSVLLRINNEKSVKVTGVRPSFPLKIEETSFEINLSSIDQTTQKKLIVYFDLGPNTLKLAVSGFIRYKNFEGFARFLRLESIDIDQTLPIFTPEDANTKIIEPFMKSKHVYRRLQAFGLPNITDANLASQYMDQAAEGIGFHHVSKIEKKDSRMSFWFATFQNPAKEIFRILLVPQVKNNVLAFYCCGIYETIVANLIRKVCYDLLAKLRKDGILTVQDNLIDMNCIRCNKMITIFPPKGDVIACSSCQLLQTPW